MSKMIMAAKGKGEKERESRVFKIHINEIKMKFTL